MPRESFKPDYYKQMLSICCSEDDDIDIVKDINMKDIREIMPPVYLNQPKEHVRKEAERQRNRPIPQKEFDVLPMNEPSNEVKFALSMRHNPYLKCKLKEFLSSGVKDFTRIETYDEYLERTAVKKSGPFRLSGGHYDKQNKPAPVPFSPHPSTYNKKSTLTKSSSTSIGER